MLWLIHKPRIMPSMYTHNAPVRCQCVRFANFLLDIVDVVETSELHEMSAHELLVQQAKQPKLVIRAQRDKLERDLSRGAFEKDLESA